MIAGRRTRILLGLVAVAALVGCAVGKEFKTNRVNDIKIGQTSRSDVFDMFGRPYQKGVEDGQLTWTYSHYKYGIGSKTKTQTLKIRFDNQDRVSSYSYDSNVPGEILE